MEIVGSSTIGRPDRWGHGTGAFHLLSLASTDLHVAAYMPIVLMTQDFLHNYTFTHTCSNQAYPLLLLFLPPYRAIPRRILLQPISYSRRPQRKGFKHGPKERERGEDYCRPR